MVAFCVWFTDRMDTVKACMKTSPLLQNVNILTLKTKLRAENLWDQMSAQFSKKLLAVNEAREIPVYQICSFVNNVHPPQISCLPDLANSSGNSSWLCANKWNGETPTRKPLNLQVIWHCCRFTKCGSLSSSFWASWTHRTTLTGIAPQIRCFSKFLRKLEQPRLWNGTRFLVK